MSAMQYKYAPLDENASSIRILHLQPAPLEAPLRMLLSTHTLGEDRVEYEALSYTWGDPTPIMPILIDEQAFLISRNLHSALCHLRSAHKPRALWVDALCINQADDEEKSEQVSQMHRIYALAEIVIAWLGPEANNSGLAFDQIERLANVSSTEIEFRAEKRKEVLQVLHHTEAWKAIQALAERQYWTRGWVVQELVHARDAVVMCGTRTFPIELLHSFVQNLLSSREDNLWPMGLDALGVMYMLLSNVYGTAKDKEISILEHLRRFAHYRVSNIRDRIYAFHSLPSAEDKTDLVVDYRLSVVATYEQFAKWHVHTTKTLDILSYAYAPEYNNTGYLRLDPNLGTWAPDWLHNRETTRPLLEYEGTPAQPVYTTSGDSQTLSELFAGEQGNDMFKHNLACVGFEFDEITEVGQLFEEPMSKEMGNPKLPVLNQWESIYQRLDPDTSPYANPDYNTEPIFYLTTVKGLPFFESEGGAADKVADQLAAQSLTESEATTEKPSEAQSSAITQPNQDPDPISSLALPTQDSGSAESPTSHRSELSTGLLDRIQPPWITPGMTVLNTALQQEFHLPDLPSTRLSLLEAYWRTLIADKFVTRRNDWRYLQPGKVKPGRAGREVWRLYCNWHDGVPEPNGSAEIVMRKELEFPLAMMGSVVGRRFFVTSRGYMGLAPKMARVGDTVAVVWGSKTPLVLRNSAIVERGDGLRFKMWTFVGDCYLHGIMDGEAMEGKTPDDFKLFLLR